MGWWATNKDGVSFAGNDGPEMFWGDGPADIFDGALNKIDSVFIEEWNRPPSNEELLAGLLFSLGARPGD